MANNMFLSVGWGFYLSGVNTSYFSKEPRGFCLASRWCEIYFTFEGRVFLKPNTKEFGGERLQRLLDFLKPYDVKVTIQKDGFLVGRAKKLKSEVDFDVKEQAFFQAIALYVAGVRNIINDLKKEINRLKDGKNE